ncbi:MAG: YdcF family protein [Clostridiales bacterium]|nr:YdcF family protein [Clostridiales bacterium]
MKKPVSLLILISWLLTAVACNEEPRETYEISIAPETSEREASTATEPVETAMATLETEPTDVPAIVTEQERAIVEEMINAYGAQGDAASPQIDECLDELRVTNPVLADKWERIMALWAAVNADTELNYDVLPDGLPDTDELCIVALGYQLNYDGSMRDELIGRLNVVLESARKYPNTLIVCTGGGTAYGNESATEAGRMAEYLIDNGIAEDRVIIEDQSLTTSQNAIFTCEILAESFPQVSQIAIITSDYHVPTGVLLMQAQAILMSQDPEQPFVQVISNAAYDAPFGEITRLSQAGSLVELLMQQQLT